MQALRPTGNLQTKDLMKRRGLDTVWEVRPALLDQRGFLEQNNAVERKIPEFQVI